MQFSAEIFSLKSAVVDLLEKARPNGLKVEEILAGFGSRSHAFLILFLCLPFIQPLPIFGLSTPIGLFISVIGLFMAFGRKPWLPKKFSQKHVSFSVIEKFCLSLIKILNKTEKWIRPRGGFWMSSRLAKIVDGILIAIFGVLLAMPLPVPFTNTIPGYFLLINAIGWLERDGIFLVISYVIAIVGIIFFVVLGGGIVEAIHLLKIKISFL